MTSLDLRLIVAEELARAEQSLDAFGVGTDRTAFDPVIPGFAVRHRTSGRRSYVVQTKIAGRMRTVTIGRAEIIPEAVARDVARRIVLRVDVGLDPAEDRHKVRHAPVYEAFLEQYWRSASPNWKPSTQRAAQHYRRNILESAFPGRFLDEIEHADAVRWHAGVTRSNGPGAANRAMEFLRAAFNKAELWGYIAEHSNPFCGIKANRQRKIERYLNDDEMARLGAALRNPCQADRLPATAILLLALTGCRRGEILDLTWSEVRGRRLVLQDSKTGPRIVWLGAEARGLLDRLPRSRSEPRVFPVPSFVNHVIQCWRRAKDKADISNLRLHDLRHSYASFAVRRSETLVMIGGLLGHAKIGTSQRYAHLDDATLLEASDTIGLAINTWMREGSKVSSFAGLVSRNGG